MSEFNIVFFAINILIILIMGLFMILAPVITRKCFLFGIRVPENVTSNVEVNNIKREYFFKSTLLTFFFLFLTIFIFLICEEIMLLVMMYLPIFFVSIQLFIYIPAWKKSKLLKSNMNWIIVDEAYSDTSYSKGALGNIPYIWYILSLGIIILSIILGFAFYDDLPDLIATHYDINMNPDEWSQKSIWIVLMIPITNAFTLIILLGVAVIFEKAKLQVNGEEIGKSFAQHKIYRKRIGHAFGFLTFSLILIISLLMFPFYIPDYVFNIYLIFFLMLPPLIPLLVVIIVSGQGGCKIKVKEFEEVVNVQSKKVYDKNDDRFWILGLFYYNKEDQALFVEDRFGSNFGFNYAHKKAKVITILLAILLIISYAVCTVLFFIYFK